MHQSCDPPAQLTSSNCRSPHQELRPQHHAHRFPRPPPSCRYTQVNLSSFPQGPVELIGSNTPNFKQTTFYDARSSFPISVYPASMRSLFLMLACCRRLNLSAGSRSARFHGAIVGVPSHHLHPLL